MDTSSLITAINDEIDRLTKVRELLRGGNGMASRAEVKRKRRALSAEARERIAAAQRKRWAAQKRAAK